MASYEYGLHGFLCDDNLKPNPVVLCDFGVERKTSEDYYYDNTCRPENYDGYIFQFTLEGCGIFETQGKTYRLEPGCAFFVPVPHDSKYYFSSDIGCDHWTFFYVHIAGPVTAQIADKIIRRYGNFLRFQANAPFVAEFFQEYSDVRNGKRYERYEASIFVYQFILHVLQECEENQSPKTSAIEQGYHWICRHYSENFGLDELCDKLHISTAHFSRQFHQQYGTSPTTFTNRLRLEYAISLLLNSNLTIKEIAARSGYSDSNYFSKIFRKHTDMTPSEYREGHRGIGEISS